MPQRLCHSCGVFDAEASFNRIPGLHARRMGDETVMFHPPAGEYFALGSVGTRIWSLLEQPITVAEICDRLRDEFAVDEDRCRDDVMAFIAELRAANLLEERR